MLDEKSFPSLSLERNSGRIMAKNSIGQTSKDYDAQTRFLAQTFVRLVDSSIMEYNAARDAYLTYYTSKDLGGSIPVSKLLLPMLSHVENCVSNTARSIKLGDAVRTSKIINAKQLVNKLDWKTILSAKDKIIDLRNSIQHMDEEIKNGKPSGGVDISADGTFKIGDASIGIVEFNNTLAKLHEIALNVSVLF